MLRSLFTSLAALLLAAVTASAQGYPAKPVHVICANPPGGGTDLVTRIVIDKLSERIGQRFVVENKPGASGILAGDTVAHAASDGYTLMTQPDSFIIAPWVLPKVPIDVLKDFVPVVMMASVPMILSVHPSRTPRDVASYIALAKAKPGALTYASAGNGSPQHLVGELLKRQAGIDILHVPYKGAAPAVADAIAGQVDSIVMGFAGIAAHVKAGRLIPIAAATEKRAAVLPDLRTMAEQGVEGVAITSWFGILAPAGTPAAVVQRLNDATNAVLKLDDVKARFADLGLEPLGGTADAFAAVMRRDFQRYGQIVRAANITAD